MPTATGAGFHLLPAPVIILNEDIWQDSRENAADTSTAFKTNNAVPGLHIVKWPQKSRFSRALQTRARKVAQATFPQLRKKSGKNKSKRSKLR